MSGLFPSLIILRFICAVFVCIVFPATVFLTRIPFFFLCSPIPSTAKILFLFAPGMSFLIGNPQWSDPPVIWNSYPSCPSVLPITLSPTFIPRSGSNSASCCNVFPLYPITIFVGMVVVGLGGVFKSNYFLFLFPSREGLVLTCYW